MLARRSNSDVPNWKCLQTSICLSPEVVQPETATAG